MNRRWFYLIIVSVSLHLNAWAQQNQLKYTKCSSRTAILVNQYRADLLTKASLHDMTGSSSECVDLFFKIADKKGWQVLEEVAAKVVRISERIGTASVDLGSLEWVIDSPHIQFVQVASLMEKSMDRARTNKNSNAYKSLLGENLSHPYRGKGVIIGVVDVGFDFTHPNLYDMEGKNYRVNWAWDQRTSPVPLRLSPEQLLEKRYSGDGLYELHGTHVVGIAAGGGFGTTNLAENDFGNAGVAPESEICLVATTMENTDVVNGVKAIFDYADEVQKPCVVNLSLGASNGPHDGTDLFSESISALTREGRIVVASSGNGGMDYSYLDIGAEGGKQYTFVPFDKGRTVSLVELWGAEKNTDFSVSLDVYDKSTGQYRGESEPLKASEITKENHTITIAEDLQVEVGGGLSEANGKYTMMLNLSAEGLQKEEVYVLAFSSTKEVHARAVVNCSFSNAGSTDEKIKQGRTDHSTCMPAEGKNVIAVGNYVTRQCYCNLKGEEVILEGETEGALATTSSYGPTYDGRYCPLVTAPGGGILSSYNKFYTDKNRDKIEQRLMTETVFHEETYPWGIMSGTSMSTPYVAGTIALWLQADPTLTPADIRGVILRTSRSDRWTGACPNDRWGYGKIDTYGGLLEVLDLATANEDIFDIHPEEAVTVFVDYSGQVNIRWAETPAYFTVSVFDLLGRKLNEETIGHAVSSEYMLSAALMQRGLYIVKVDTEKGTVTRKVKY